MIACVVLSHELPKDDAKATINNSIGMTLKLIPAGEFFMGSPDDAIEAQGCEKPSHRVRISKRFYLGVCEVTQAQYEAVMGNNPSHFSANGGGKDMIAGQSTDRYPVEHVSWRDAVQFCNKLSQKEGKKPFYEIDGKDTRVPDWNGQGYRLPTEAEWEYACRANASTPTRFSFGDNMAELGLYGWFVGNSELRTHPVGQKRANGFGLYDMHGNVWEWCWDWYGEGYYNQSAADDPTGPAGPSFRLIRGGSWRDVPVWSAYRGQPPPINRGYDLGFRVARGQSEKQNGSYHNTPSEATNTAGSNGSSSTSAVESRGRAVVDKPSISPATKPIGTVTNPLGMALNLIPAGDFLMGSPDGEKDAPAWEKPQHRVQITRSFYLGKYEVTQALYQDVTGKNPSSFRGDDPGNPVERVSWLDAVEFCNKLSEREGFKPFYEIGSETAQVPDWNGTGYRLPTDAEWEYACRAGTATRYSFGDDNASLGEFAWFDGNSNTRTHVVGQKRANGFGLHDMHGNVWEWCWDWFAPADYLKNGPAGDPHGPPSSAGGRVVRGGSWRDLPDGLRSSTRNGIAPNTRARNHGFRVARSPASLLGK